MNRVETDQEKIARLEHDLAECYKLTGADPDGNEDWRLAPRAVEAVRELRADCDAALDSTMTYSALKERKARNSHRRIKSEEARHA